MASGSNSLPLQQWKILAGLSGNRCAFPKCGQYLAIPGETSEGDLVLGVAAHIVAASRQGPRGDFKIDADERDRSARNRILVCPTHHTEIDARPCVYTVQVLRQMKEAHERPFLPAEEIPSSPEVQETLHGSFLAVTALPSCVMSLPLADPNLRERDVAQSVVWPADRDVVMPYIVREGRLHTFADITKSNHAFSKVVTGTELILTEAQDLWKDPEGHRRYIALLNKTLMKHLGRDGVRYDRDHHRYWFMADPGPKNRTKRYRTKQGQWRERSVVLQRVRKKTQEGKEWAHIAAGLRFEHVADESWILSIRPEFQFTKDGETPLPPKIQGSKSTRKKSHIYNDGYLGLLHFWLEYLMADQPRLMIRAADQRIEIEGELATCDVKWPGVPGDTSTYKLRDITENLFSALDHEEVSEELFADGGWWDGEDEEEPA